MIKRVVQLDFFEDVMALPWYGRAPRDFTRVALSFIFKAQAAKDERFFDVDQLPLFPRLVKKAPWTYQGAPLLKEV